MNAEELKFQVTGPYQPLNLVEIKEFPGEKFYRKPDVSTLKTALELASFYRSVLVWRAHNNPMAYAGLFSIFFVFESIDCYDSKKNRRVPEDLKKSACGVRKRRGESAEMSRIRSQGFSTV